MQADDNWKILKIFAILKYDLLKNEEHWNLKCRVYVIFRQYLWNISFETSLLVEWSNIIMHSMYAILTKPWR